MGDMNCFANSYIYRLQDNHQQLILNYSILPEEWIHKAKKY